MKLAFFNNSLNHHQVPVADEFYKLLGNDYVFISTEPIAKIGLKGGKDYSNRPYCIMAEDNSNNKRKALALAREADVCVFGAESLHYAVERAKHNPKGLSFELSERWLKRGWINVLSPRLIKWWWTYQTCFKGKNFHKLCSSAFAAGDHFKLLTYKNRCYKWAYFTKVEGNESTLAPTEDDAVSIMWCSRFLVLKHPELAILMAKRLHDRDYKFKLDMFGSGEVLEKSKDLVKAQGLDGVVNFHGSLPNEQVLQEMRKHEIFLFTSDQHEGWGAVSNESMSNGCVLVGADTIGSIPFLVKDKVNGLIFRGADKSSGFTSSSLRIDEKALESLTENVEWLLKNPDRRDKMRKEAMKTMQSVWSPANAANNFLQLSKDLLNGAACSIQEGPCSIAK